MPAMDSTATFLENLRPAGSKRSSKRDFIVNVFLRQEGHITADTLVDLIRRLFPQSDVRVLDTVCKPTKERQSAAVEMARQADVVVVVGGRSSNNTRELVKTCARYCARVHHVQTDADVRPEWFDAAAVVGLTAGTSTPDDVIDRVEARIRERR